MLIPRLGEGRARERVHARRFAQSLFRGHVARDCFNNGCDALTRRPWARAGRDCVLSKADQVAGIGVKYRGAARAGPRNVSVVVLSWPHNCCFLWSSNAMAKSQCEALRLCPM